MRLEMHMGITLVRLHKFLNRVSLYIIPLIDHNTYIYICVTQVCRKKTREKKKNKKNGTDCDERYRCLMPSVDLTSFFHRYSQKKRTIGTYPSLKTILTRRRRHLWEVWRLGPTPCTLKTRLILSETTKTFTDFNKFSILFAK